MGRGIFKTLEFVINSFLNIVYPNDEKCVVCGQYSTKNLCRNCEENIEFLNTSFSIEHNKIIYKYYSIASHKKAMRDIIIALKYNNNFNAASIIADYMEKLILNKKLSIDVVTFVPMAKRDENRRGFNQAKVIAEILARKLNKPCVRLIKKKRITKDQIGLSSSERWNNINGSFVYEKKAKKYNSILLIDDVITTGATVINCVNELKKCEIRKIYILTASKSIV